MRLRTETSERHSRHRHRSTPGAGEEVNPEWEPGPAPAVHARVLERECTDLLRWGCLGAFPAIEARRMPAIQIHLGTMTFGWGQASETVDERVAGEFVTAFTAAGHNTIDYARICKTVPPEHAAKEG